VYLFIYLLISFEYDFAINIYISKHVVSVSYVNSTSYLPQGGSIVDAWAAPRILRWEYKTRFASGASEKKMYPTFPNVGVQAI